MSHYFGLPRYMPGDEPLPVLRPSVLHLHRFAIVPRRTVYLVRDPRDVAVSYYHKIANIAGPALRARIERALPLPYAHENLRRNLPAWIRLVYTSDVGGAIAFDRHVRRARALALHRVRYEDLLERGEPTVVAAVEHLTGAPADPERVRRALDETSFETRTGRRRGEQDLRWVAELPRA